LSAAQQKGELLLAMETSGDVCSVAVLRDGRLGAEHVFRHEMHLSERLMDHLDRVLHEAGGALSDLAAYAVGVGPGSFTGTRIGVMTIKTLALVQGAPIYPVDSLAAMAAEYTGVGEWIVPLLPCRADVVYTGTFAVDGVAPHARISPAAVAVNELLHALTSESQPGLLFCGEAADRYRNVLSAGLAGKREFAFGRVRCPRAAVIGELAWQRRQAGDAGQDPLNILPLYISPPPITMPKTGARLTDVEI
jgi:tRNA threonylcarbamoyladenosine biosynthesis protein TsaB